MESCIEFHFSSHSCVLNSENCLNNTNLKFEKNDEKIKINYK